MHNRPFWICQKSFKWSNSQDKNNYKRIGKTIRKRGSIKDRYTWWKKENVAVNISITCNYEKCKKYYYDACS